MGTRAREQLIDVYDDIDRRLRALEVGSGDALERRVQALERRCDALAAFIEKSLSGNKKDAEEALRQIERQPEPLSRAQLTKHLDDAYKRAAARGHPMGPTTWPAQGGAFAMCRRSGCNMGIGVTPTGELEGEALVNVCKHAPPQATSLRAVPKLQKPESPTVAKGTSGVKPPPMPGRYKPKTCKRCKREFQPTHGRCEYCRRPDCTEASISRPARSNG